MLEECGASSIRIHEEDRPPVSVCSRSCDTATIGRNCRAGVGELIGGDALALGSIGIDAEEVGQAELFTRKDNHIPQNRAAATRTYRRLCGRAASDIHRYRRAVEC